MPYDYTRVRVGDTVRDDQSLKEGRIIDIQIAGQWVAFVTILFVADGYKKEFAALLKEAPSGVDLAAAATLGRTPIPTGRELDLKFDTATSGIKLSVVRKASEAEAAASQAAKKTESKGPIARLRRFVDDLYAGRVRAAGDSSVEIRPTVDKSVITELVDKLEKRGESSGGGSLKDLVQAITTPGSGTPAKRVEKLLESLPSAGKNKEALRELSRVIVSAETRNGAISGKFAAAKGAAAARTASEVLATGGRLNRELFRRPDFGGLYDVIGAEPETLSAWIASYGTDYTRKNILDPLDEMLNIERSYNRMLGRTRSNIRAIDKMWMSVMSDPEGTIKRVHGILDVETSFGSMTSSQAKLILTDLTEAFSLGRRGAAKFQDVRSKLVPLLKDYDDYLTNRAPQYLEEIYATRANVARLLNVDDEAPLDVAGMNDEADEKIQAFRQREGRMASSKAIADEAAHKRATLEKSKILGQDTKFGRLIEAAEHVRKQKAFDNIVEREWLGMRYEILGVAYDEYGRPKVKARPAASRVLDAEGFELLTNIRLKGRSAQEALKSTLTNIIAAGMDESAFIGLSDMFAAGGHVYNSGLPSQMASDAMREARLGKMLSGPISITGHKFESMGSFMSSATGVSESDAWKSFQRRIAAAVQQEHGLSPAIERGAVTRYGVPVSEIREEAIQNAIVAYNEAIRGASAASLRDAHEEAMQAAVKAAVQPRYSRIRSLSLDQMLGDGKLDAALGQTGNTIPGVLESITTSESRRNRKVELVLKGRFDLNDEVVDALLNQDISPVHHTAIRKNLRSIGIEDDEIIEAFIDHSRGRDTLKRASLISSGLPEDLADAFVKRDTESIKVASKYLRAGAEKKLAAAGVDSDIADLVMGGHFSGLYSRTRQKAERIVSTYQARMADKDHLFNFLMMDMDAKTRNQVQRIMAGETNALLSFLPAAKRRTAAQYYNAGVYGVLPEDTLKKVFRVFTDDTKLDYEFSRILKREAKEIANQVVDQIVFNRPAASGAPFNPIIADVLPADVLDALRAMSETVDSVTAADDFLTIPLSRGMLRQLMTGSNGIMDMFAGTGLARTHEIAAGGSLSTGFQIRKDGRLYTTAGQETVVDALKNVFVFNPDIAYDKLSAEILLPENMGKLTDVAIVDQLASSVTNVTDSKLYTLPGHSNKQFQLISTNESHDQFMRQIRTMRELAAGRGNLYVLDIEANPVTGDVLARPDRPPGIHEVGWIKAAPEQIDGRWGYKAVGEGERFVAKAAADERSLIKRVADLVRSASGSNPMVIATHYKPYDFPTLIERAMAHGMVDDAAELAAAYKGVNPFVSHIDTMVAAQLADPGMSSFSVEAAAKALRVKESTWKEAHTTIEDVQAELGILNAVLARGQENMEHLLAQSGPTELGDQYVWRVQGRSGESGRLYRIVGNYQTAQMKEQSLSGILMREMQLDQSGRLVASPHLTAEANAAHILGGSISGRFVPVSPEQGTNLLKERVEDLGSRIVRDMLDSPTRPSIEKARLEAVKTGGVNFPQVSPSDLENPASNAFTRYQEAERTAYWLDEFGRDWRRRAQTERYAADWLEGEYKYVHRPFYEFVKGLDVDESRQKALLSKWHERMDNILGSFASGTAEVQPFARQLSVDLPGLGTVGFNISSGSRLSESINQAARRYTKHLDAIEAAKIVGEKASSDQMRAFFASGQDMSILPHQAQDAIREHTWNQVVFPAFASSRSDFAERLTTQGDKDILAEALSDPETLRAELLKVGTSPEKYSPQVNDMLTARDHTLYTSRVTKTTLKDDIERSRQIIQERNEALREFRDNWQGMAPATTVEETLPGYIPNTDFFASGLRGKTVDEVFRHYEHQATLRVGQEFGSTYEAVQHGRRTARWALENVFADERAWDQLNAPVQQQLLSLLGYKSYNDGRAFSFRNRRNGFGLDPEKEAEREALYGRIADFDEQIADISSPDGLSGLADPRRPDQNLSDYSVSELRGMARDTRLSIPARERLLDLVTDLSSLTSGGLATGLESTSAYTPVSVVTKHAASRAAVENAVDYLADKVTSPKLRLAVAAMGAGTALFLGRRPNVQPEEERMSTKQRFEKQVTRTEKPLYFRVQARVSGTLDAATGATEDDLISGAREAVAAHFSGGVEQGEHSTTDSRKKFSNRVLDGIAERLTNALYPIKD